MRDKVAPNIIDPPRQVAFFRELKGFYHCNKCVICNLSHTRLRTINQFSSNCTGKCYNIESFITCETRYVVYLLEYTCHKQYVGHTSRRLRDHLREHVYKIRTGFKKHCLSLHFRQRQNRGPRGSEVYSFFKITSPMEG